MLIKNSFMLPLSLLTIITLNAQAAPSSPRILVSPSCLLTSISGYQTLAAINDLSLIQVDNKSVNALIKAKKRLHCGGFMDVTKAWKQYQHENNRENTPQRFLSNYSPSNAQPIKKTKYQIRYQTQVKALIKQMNPDEMWADLATLTSFKDRYANSENGVKAAQWFVTEMENLAKANNRTDVSTQLIVTDNYHQPSVVVKVGNSDQPGVVIGAHLDTLNSNFSVKPGADDDGSGSVTVLETARLILKSQLKFNKPIYFMWYAAEEEGLLGSQAVVDYFKKNQIPVAAVIHFDMTGYAYQNDNTMWLIKDNVDKDLTVFLGNLIRQYVNRPVKNTTCGYACSDHASWTQKGYVAAMPFESSLGKDNPDIHTSRDTMDKLSLSHMTDFAKLGLAYTIELAEPA